MTNYGFSFGNLHIFIQQCMYLFVLFIILIFFSDFQILIIKFNIFFSDKCFYCLVSFAQLFVLAKFKCDAI